MHSSKKYFLTLKFTKAKYFLLAFLFTVFFSEKIVSSTLPLPIILSNDDSLKKIINKEPRKAALMSMILPGLGQAYNKKYWYIKIPLIYAAFGGLGYYAMKNNQNYQNYHNELKYRYDNYPLINTFKDTTTANLIIIKDATKKHRDFLFMGLGIVYLINIIDASVSAHMKTFDVSDKLSLSISPKALYCSRSPYGFAGGVSLVLNFAQKRKDLLRQSK